MGKRIKSEDFDLYLKALSKNHRIFAPMISEGKGKFALTNVVGYGEVTCLDDIELKEKSYYSPKEIFYPVRETLFYFMGNKTETPEIDTRPIIIIARPCDINGINRLDKIFLENGNVVDFYYLRRRELVKTVLLECLEGFDTCFCVSMNTNKAEGFNGAIRINDDEIHLDMSDQSLQVGNYNDFADSDLNLDFIQENKTKVTIPDPDKVTKDMFDHDLWTEYTSRCIACGRCNTSCITCSCYTMQDTKLSDDKTVSQRRRIWAGCHVDGFSDMAGGHGFREKNGERMRFKTMHKINDYYKRFGLHMCVGCGRCDDVCPEYISFSKCINKLNEIVKEADNE